MCVCLLLDLHCVSRRKGGPDRAIVLEQTTEAPNPRNSRGSRLDPLSTVFLQIIVDPSDLLLLCLC